MSYGSKWGSSVFENNMKTGREISEPTDAARIGLFTGNELEELLKEDMGLPSSDVLKHVNDNKMRMLKELEGINSEEPPVMVISSPILARSRVNEILSSSICAIECQGINTSGTREVTLIQVAYPFQAKLRCAMFDVKLICKNSKNDIDIMKPLLEGNGHKLCHDVFMDAALLTDQFGITLSNVIDTQLVFEYMSGKMLSSSSEFLHWCEVSEHPNKNNLKRIVDADSSIWGKRPLSQALIRYATSDVICLLKTTKRWMSMLESDKLNIILTASKSRCTQKRLGAPKRKIGFGDVSLAGGESNSIHSWELLSGINPAIVNAFSQVKVDENVKDLMDYIPETFHDFFRSENISTVRDIIFEVGGRPYAYYGPQRRVFLSDDSSVVISVQQMKNIVDSFQSSFSSNNRAGINRSLHRISAMRSNKNEIYSLTFRVGRAVYGNTGIMKDILTGSLKSVLVMGIPGTGKTTIIRDMAKVLSEAEFNVIIVDTSNEIGGDGVIPHPSVGMARRMMVPSLKEQPGVLIEAVQNHTPDVIICDEIGRVQEVLAMQTVKERGVRCIASAHGNLRTLVNNKQLNGLVGGVENVTLGDVEALKDQHKMGGEFSKVRQQRGGIPVFDVIVELRPNLMDEWTIITDVPTAVDRILAGKTYSAQVRRRDSNTGSLSLEIVQC